MSVRSPVVTVSRAFCLIIAFAAVPAAVAIAEPLARPTGPVVLTITGAITETNAPGKAEFDQAMLDALGADEVKTSTEWTEGTPTWQGVRFSKVLDAVGAKGTTVVATALNDYSGEIGIDLIRDYPVLLATAPQRRAAGRRQGADLDHLSHRRLPGAPRAGRSALGLAARHGRRAIGRPSRRRNAWPSRPRGGGG